MENLSLSVKLFPMKGKKEQVLENVE